MSTSKDSLKELLMELNKKKLTELVELSDNEMEATTKKLQELYPPSKLIRSDTIENYNGGGPQFVSEDSNDMAEWVIHERGRYPEEYIQMIIILTHDEMDFLWQFSRTSFYRRYSFFNMFLCIKAAQQNAEWLEYL